ncbi:MAG: hydrogen gas-evolving membrane-bound hydrogenase subunit E, partial [Staphylococcus simulans]
YAAAFIAAVFHLINHATFKCALFMIAGIIDHETGTRDVRKLGGLMTIMPISFTITVISALSMAGVPPFNGFLSKESFLEAMINVTQAPLFNLNTLGVLIPIVAILGSIFTFVYSVRFIGQIFWGSYKPESLPHKPHEPSVLMWIAPAFLAVLVVVFGLFPTLLAKPIIDPASQAIRNAKLPDAEFHLFHGFTPAFFSTLVIYAIGILLIFTYHKWVKVLENIPERLELNHFYDRSADNLPVFSKQVTHTYMSGFIRNKLVVIMGSLIVLTAVTVLALPFAFDFSHVSRVRSYEVIIVVMILAAAIMLVFARSRLFSIIMLSAVGYSMAIFYIFFNAPDLALTQFVVETISTALFLLCFYHLPNLNRYNETTSFKVTNAVIAAGVGIAVTILGLIAYGNKHFDSIAAYYKENVHSLAHGNNMVNVILVDFRGTDTLFESSVLGIAGLAVYTLIKLRSKHKNGYERVDENEQTEK